ncbi:pyroglutamyl-peptidase I [Bombiscardovia coagulans]|uniref:Pyroglutamyl-peptidase I n=1 Tax=Bombiscardovia coagulans TaxID=686666 RepID=A0A261EU32_9BIFI|nr:pyroglutamyl-peptidase I [Bombiscardovia coagulans]OZG50368.1 peptidase C15 [Bombiscardovia coagulans]
MEKINVIISGYDHYEGVQVNPSMEVARALAERGITPSHDSVKGEDPLDRLSMQIKAVALPVSFEQAWPILHQAIEEFQPNIVISTGLKRRARSIAMERCAVNIKDTTQEGESAERSLTSNGEPIDSKGPAAYWTRLPLRSILHAFSQHGIAATLSSDAGTYVCNAVFYSILNWAKAHPDVLAGFVSLPPVVDATATNQRNLGLPLEQQIQAGQDVVREAVRYYIQPSSCDMLIA